jgi:hypothetical protein
MGNKSGFDYVSSKSLKMTTFLEEVVGESTWMLPLELGCTDDGIKGTVASKVQQFEDLKLENKSKRRPTNL